MRIPRPTLLLAAGVLALAPVCAAADGGHTMVRPETIEWRPIASLPAGAELAVLEGQMDQPAAFTARLRFPANYRIPPHYHPVKERVTVLSGTFHMGIGERFDAAAGMALTPGAMMLIEPEHRHFAWTGEQPAVIQLHGTGPWGITYVDPADDPRRAGASP